jgi:hypothetical protein
VVRGCAETTPKGSPRARQSYRERGVISYLDAAGEDSTVRRKYAMPERLAKAANGDRGDTAFNGRFKEQPRGAPTDAARRSRRLGVGRAPPR